MVPVLLVPRCPRVLGHATVGCSTGCVDADRGDWPALARAAADVSTLAVELSALSEPELPALIDYLEGDPRLPFRYVAIHAPTKRRALPERELVDLLGQLAAHADAIVVHPDEIRDPAPYRELGPALVLENMDARKPAGRTADELEAAFAELPEAGLCFDVAHVDSIDPTLAEGQRILARFGHRLRHVHLSSLDADCHHVPLTAEDERRFAPLLGRCRDVPWILEAPLRDS